MVTPWKKALLFPATELKIFVVVKSIAWIAYVMLTAELRKSKMFAVSFRANFNHYNIIFIAVTPL